MDVQTQWTSDRSIRIAALREDGILATSDVTWPTPGEAEANCERAVRLFTEKNIADAVREVGQGQKCVRVGPLFVTTLWGPPTWWLPRVRIHVKQRRMMVGWLRRGYVVALRGH